MLLSEPQCPPCPTMAPPQFAAEGDILFWTLSILVTLAHRVRLLNLKHVR